MSTAKDARKSIQRILGVADDGSFGPKTQAAYDRLKSAPEASVWPPVETPPITPIPVPGSLDERTERNLATLDPKAQPVFRELMAKIIPIAAADGLTVKITSGNRTYAEQNELYAQGRTKPGDIVTKAKAGFSNHNFAIAIDLTVFSGNGKVPIYEHPLYKTFGPIGEQLGLEWGGRWTGIKDEPHYEIKTGLTMSAKRALMASKGSVL
jgi:peptidoglycan L-alanyl-D-glutamate endopeptidase CwlK